MNVLRINKATLLVENMEVWDELPAETPTHLFIEGSGNCNDVYDPVTETVAPPPPPPRDLEAEREQKLVAAADLFGAKMQEPFSWNFGATATKDDMGDDGPAAGVQTLQMRVAQNTDDPKNWLAIGLGALIALSGNAGGTVMPIKASSNLWVQTVAGTLVQVLAVGDGSQLPMLERQRLTLSNFGRLKMLIRDAADLAELDAIDIATGWPV